MKGYKHILADLEQHEIIPIDGTEYYEYEGFRLEEEFDKFFNFGQTYLEREDLEFKIAPAVICFNSGLAINAVARNKKGFRSIEIYKGAIFKMYSMFMDLQPLFASKSLGNIEEISNNYGLSSAYIMFQFCSLYFFYHEVGHLIQGSVEEFTDDYMEFTGTTLSSEEIAIKHLRELDADWFASQKLPLHILRLRGEGLPDLPPHELIEMAAVALSSIYIYHIRQSSGIPKLYFGEYSHPHPAVRLSFLILYLLKGLDANINYKLDQPAILKRSIEISVELLLPEGNIVEEYSTGIYNNAAEIEDYINVIIANSKKYASLSIHKLYN